MDETAGHEPGRDCIYEYAMGRDGVKMEEICEENNFDQRYRVMARAHDEIGWWRFMEGGMICKEIGGFRGPTRGYKLHDSAPRNGEWAWSPSCWRRHMANGSITTSRFTIRFLSH
jgi:hypothetical protein